MQYLGGPNQDLAFRATSLSKLVYCFNSIDGEQYER